MQGRIAHRDTHHEKHDIDDVEPAAEAIKRRLSISVDELQNQAAKSHNPIAKAYLKSAIWCNKVTSSDWFNQSIMLCIIIAGILVGIQTYEEFENDPAVLGLNMFVLYAFTVECVLKIVAEGFKPYLYFTGPERMWNNFDFVIVVVCLPIWGDLFGGGSVAILRLMRLMRVMKIVKKVPQLQMIMMGLIAGMSSIKYILILLGLILYLFAIAGIYAFRTNDPMHFSSLQIAMLTLFRASTLEDWTDVMYINIYGCDYWYGKAAGYEVAPKPDIQPNLNQFYTSCTENVAKPEITVIYFVLFIVISAFVMLSLFVGAVSMGMADAVDTMKEMEYKVERDKKLQKVQGETQDRRKKACFLMCKYATDKKYDINQCWSNVGGSRTVTKHQLSKLLQRFGCNEEASNGFDLDDVLQEVLLKTGNDVEDARDSDIEVTMEAFQECMEEFKKPVTPKKGSQGCLSFVLGLFGHHAEDPANPGSEKINSEERFKRQQLRNVMMKIMGIPEEDLELSHARRHSLHEVTVKTGTCGSLIVAYTMIAKKCHWFCNLAVFVNFITFIIIVAGLLVGIGTYPGMETNTALTVLDQIILAIFTFEVAIKIIAENFHPWAYFYSGWNTFDFIIVLGSFLLGGSFITMLRLLRLLRVLKLVKSLPQLQLIVDALVQGLASIGYIGVILVLVFYVFAILGMTLFKKNDPWHFGTLAKAMLTLFRCSTLEDWTDVMYINMYGCKNYGYSDAPDLCTDSKPSYWMALFYFVAFTILGSLVLLTLFIGVVCTSMAEAQDKQACEKDVEDRAVEIKCTLVKRKGSENGKTGTLSEACDKIGGGEKHKVTWDGDDVHHEVWGRDVEFCIPTEQFEMFREVFIMMDIDHGGTIELDELMLALESIGLKLPKRVAQRLVEEADSDNTGDIDFAEFLQFMTSCRSWKDKPPQTSTVVDTPQKKSIDSNTPTRIEAAQKALRKAMKKVQKCTQKQGTNLTIVTLAGESLPLLHEVEKELEDLLQLVQSALPESPTHVKEFKSIPSATALPGLKQDERRSPSGGKALQVEN